MTLFFFSITVEPACNSTASIPKHKTENKISKFDMAVELIKQKEGWHDRRHKYYVGYGHRLLKSDTFNHDISEEFADSLLRKDLLQNAACSENMERILFYLECWLIMSESIIS